MNFQDETDSLVFLTSGFVARSLQIAADMRLARALPEVKNPARLNLILKAHWNQTVQGGRVAIVISRVASSSPTNCSATGSHFKERFNCLAIPPSSTALTERAATSTGHMVRCRVRMHCRKFPEWLLLW